MDKLELLKQLFAEHDDKNKISILKEYIKENGDISLYRYRPYNTDDRRNYEITSLSALTSWASRTDCFDDDLEGLNSKSKQKDSQVVLNHLKTNTGEKFRQDYTLAKTSKEQRQLFMAFHQFGSTITFSSVTKAILFFLHYFSY